MAKEQERNNCNPRVFLVRAGINHTYVIKAEKGHEISPITRHQNDDEAIQWAKAFISTWPNWELVCLLKEK